MLEGQIARELDKIWSNGNERTWIPARLGVSEGADADIDVTGKKGYVIVSIGAQGDLGVTMARDAVGAERINFQRIKLRRENGELVIREATSYSGTGTGPGGGADSFMDLDDVQNTGWDNGEVPVWNTSLGKLVPTALPPGTVYSSGSGIDIATSTISLKRKAADSGLAFDGSNGVYVNRGDGLAISSNVLSVLRTSNSGLIFSGGAIGINPGAGLEINTNAIRVNQAYGFTWT